MAAVLPFLAARRLQAEGRNIAFQPQPAPALLAIAGGLALAFAAGRLARRGRPEVAAAPLQPPPRVSSAKVRLAALFGILSAALFAGAWGLQGRSAAPLSAVGLWAASLLAGGGACALAGGSRRRLHARPHPGALAVLVAILALGAWWRIAGLHDMPPVFGGDEANQVMDGAGFLRQTLPGDPFGTGWYGTIRLGMLPAGAGALYSNDPFGGPRRPYAVAGILSLAVATAVAGMIGGGWAAIAAAVLLAPAAHHLHFSRLASVMILDALLAVLLLLCTLRTRETGSAGWGFGAGTAAGLALYGYAGGRVLPVVFLLALPVLLSSPAARGRRALLALALVAGFALAAVPNLRFAVHHFADWNGRFNQVGILRADWWGPKVQEFGSPARLLWHQFVEGTLGLVFRRSAGSWFTGYPVVEPFLAAIAVAGLGWLAGLGRRFAAALLALIIAGNLAGTILTDSTPSPQRVSSLFPMLAILGGAAVAGFLSLLPEGRTRWLRTAAGGVAVAALLLAGARALPPWGDPSPGYGGDTARFASAAAQALSGERYRRERVYLDGLPFVDSAFPLYPYLLPGKRLIDRDPGAEPDRRPEAGLHVVITEWQALVPQWLQRWGIERAVPLADPANPRRIIGYLVRVP